MYCDGALRTKGFTGEGTHGPSVIAIKSHSINPLFTHMKKLPKIVPMKVPVFGAAVLLIRNPRNALIAEWHRERTKRQSNRNISNHFLYVGEEFFGRLTNLATVLDYCMDEQGHLYINSSINCSNHG